VARLIRELASGATPSHPTLHGHGWWRRHSRLMTGAAGDPAPPPTPVTGAPILISGASGTLGRAFARICGERHLAFRVLTRHDMDIADPQSVARAIARFRPWAIVNASGYVRVDDAEHDVERCFRENALGPAVLAAACAREGVHLTTFSSDLVFDGRQNAPYVETDAMAPLNIYGLSKAAGEATVLERHPAALVVRTSSFFGPWDGYNFVAQALNALEGGQPFYAAADITVSPTYVPDLVNACLDLIIDGEAGIWHLTNGHPLTWAELAGQAARHAGIDCSRLEPQRAADCRYVATRPRYTALDTKRGILLPTLDSALQRLIASRAGVTAWTASGSAAPAPAACR
jgi:dTDP-4-dehydrorhamnose reductase